MVELLNVRTSESISESISESMSESTVIVL